jgi:abortive infection bacteriophage resistance protein
MEMTGSASVPFGKAALSAQALLAKLKSRGLVVANDNLALKYIGYVGHYRLKGYWHQLIDRASGNFFPGTSLEQIVNRYECDRKIRAVILESIERLEVAVRTTICNHLSLRYSPHWYLDLQVFLPTKSFGMGQMLSRIEQEVGRSNQKEFIASYYSNYGDPYLPPGWAMSECVTLGMWSRTFSILRDPLDQKAISAKFGITQVEVFTSWLHTLTVLRNMAAHHDRFLGCKLGVSPTNYKKRGIKFADNKSVYAALTMIHILLDAIGFNGAFKQRIADIETRYGSGLFQTLGFPHDWKNSAG